jgi:molybdate transport system ATP-binding protein
MKHAFDLAARHPGFALDARAGWDAPCAALFGASGSGKTTIVESIAGARPDVAGRVSLAGRRVDGLPARARGIGWVPQDASLFPHLTAGENVDFALRGRGDRAAADEAIEALEIGPVLGRPARELSGGERQRVAIARALASRPAFLLLDEPLASIDRPLRSRILPFLGGIPAATGVPALVVTHDPLEVLALASHVIMLESGRVVDQGDPRGIFASAATFAVLHALGAENVFDVAAGPTRRPRDGVLTITTRGGCTLEMAAVAGFPHPARVAIRSEDVLLATEEPRGISAQNVLLATIERIEPLGDHVHVSARVQGEVFRVKITARALAALGLAAEKRVFLVVKAHAIQACG